MRKTMLQKIYQKMFNRGKRQKVNLKDNDLLLFRIKEIEGMISLEEAQFLYDLAKNTKVDGENSIVEIGSYRGRSTVALARGSNDGNKIPVFAIDPHEEFVGVLGGHFGGQDRGAFYQNMLKTSCFEIVRLINLSSEVVTPGWKRRVNLLWIDGDHTYNGVKRDFNCWKPFLSQDAVIAFDDSTDSQLGPAKLLQELLDSNEFCFLKKVGKVTAIEVNRCQG